MSVVFNFFICQIVATLCPQLVYSVCAFPSFGASSLTPNPVYNALYNSALIYDIAFSYRDYPQECQTLLRWAAEARSGRAVESAIEVAAGPSDHALTFRGLGLEAYALDLSPSMCEYAAQKSKTRGLPITIICADMRDFRLPHPVDLAVMMLNSVAHLHTLDDLIQHLRAVAQNVTSDGVYILEVQHPRDFVGRGGRMYGVSTPWMVERDGLEVSVRWGLPSNPYDPLRQIFHAHIEIEAKSVGGDSNHIEDIIPMRDWTLDELRAAIRLSGVFEVSNLYGDFSLDVPLSNSEQAWRMILVLRRS